MNRATIAALLFNAILLTSCLDKEEDEKGVSIPVETLLAGTDKKEWVMTANTTNGKNSMGFLEACEADNQYVFYLEGKLEITEGESHCEESNEYIIDTDEWSVSEDGKILNWGDDVYQIKSISQEEVVLVFSEPDYEVIATLTAIQ